MRNVNHALKPQDIVILLKIIAYGKTGNNNWQQVPMAESLNISQAEVSQSLVRSKYAGLLDGSGKKVMRLALMDILQYAIAYMFPQKPGAIVRGIPTAHSALPLKSDIQSEEQYVWPSAHGNTKGQSIIPLYPSVVDAVMKDQDLYQLLALVDALRVGRTREKNIAITELKHRILNGE